MTFPRITRAILPPVRSLEELRVAVQQLLEEFRQSLFQPEPAVYAISVTSAYSVQLLDNTIFANGTFTVTLPTGPETTGRRYTIKNTGSGAITVDPSGSGTIEGTASHTLIANQSMDVVSDGTNYFIV